MEFQRYEQSNRDKDVLSREPGGYQWDDFEAKAKAAGVPEDLAQLGRAVMREAYQHNWDESLQTECGWDDDGEAMLAVALDTPGAARERWETLLRSDGGRV